VKELNIADLTTEDVKLKIKSIRSRYSSLLLIIIRQTVLETSLNDLYTYLDLHLSIQLTMCSMHLICYVSLSTTSPTTVVFYFYFFSLLCIDILLSNSHILQHNAAQVHLPPFWNRLTRSLLWNRVNSIVQPLNSMSLISRVDQPGRPV
jgi:hypothetical protein